MNNYEISNIHDDTVFEVQRTCILFDNHDSVDLVNSFGIIRL
jgi:hypothetical protein